MTMRVFQNSSTGLYDVHSRASVSNITFAGRVALFHASAFDASHTLAPVLSGEKSAFYTHGDNENWQRAWAREKGLSPGAKLEDILLAQIEEHRTEAFYNLHPGGFDSRFARRLPGSVKAKIAWQQFPFIKADLSAYLVVCTLASRLEQWRSMGLRAAYFAPAHDPALDHYAHNEERDIDVLFVGSYSRYHIARAVALEALAQLRGKRKVVLALAASRLTRLAETPLGLLGPLRRYRRPDDIRRVAQGPVFGRSYHDLLARAKIVFNGHGECEGSDRGNMRCWEALGARALLVSDAGSYPAGMVDGATIRTYRSPEHALEVIEECLVNEPQRQRIANAGYEMIRTHYSKAAQWEHFQRIVAENF
jgi:hypothetical protein